MPTRPQERSTASGAGRRRSGYKEAPRRPTSWVCSAKSNRRRHRRRCNMPAIGQDEAEIKKNLIFFKSPIGRALVGKDKGEMVTVNTPSGEKSFEILDVEYI